MLIPILSAWVSSVVELVFPGVAERFNKSAEWHKEKYGIVPQFGLFWNFCINGVFPGQKRVHCMPHADAKNIVGICVLVIYQLPGRICPIYFADMLTQAICPGKKFNHSKRSWLVLWEAGVAVQLPPWTIMAYPLSLLFHFNIDIQDEFYGIIHLKVSCAHSCF